MIREFPFVHNNDPRTERPPLALGRAALSLPDVAKVRLDALQRLSVGKPAPEIEGVDLEGKPMKLSDFRGKVVVLSIPGFGNQGIADPSDEAASHLAVFRGLAPLIEGKPAALLGVVGSRRDEHRKAVQQSGLPVRLWWDPDREGQPENGPVWGPRPGPIRTAWDAAEPNVYVIDAHGVIRHTHLFVRGTLEKAVATVLQEQAGEPAQPSKKD